MEGHETIACPDCGQRYRVAGSSLGLRLKCPKCGRSFVAGSGGDPAKPSYDEICRQNESMGKRLEELEALFSTSISLQTSIEGLDAMTLRLGEDGVIHYANSSFARYLGISKDTLIGKNGSVLQQILDEGVYKAISGSIDENATRTEVVHDGKGRTLEVRSSHKEGLLDIVMQDVTEKHRYREYVQRYISEDLVTLSEEDLRTFKYPERRFMTVGFTDLRGFTAMSEGMRPEEVRMTINSYLEEIIRAIDDNHATVDKIVGDEVMALYGAPKFYADHALRAVKTACEQMTNLRALQRSFARFGKMMPDCGIGINTGDMVIGNMGSVKHQNYTVVGSTVNIAARLCGAARGMEIILTESTLNAFLKAMPKEWETAETFSKEGAGAEEVERKVDTQPLPAELLGKVVLVGPGVGSNPKNCEYRFQYLHALKLKGIHNPMPVISVMRPQAAKLLKVLDDSKMVQKEREKIFGKYRLLEFLGRGGMGEVWKARDSFGNIVVVKTLLAGDGATHKQLQRFRREARIMAKLFHRGICRVHEVGEVDKSTYIAMEYVEGASLAELLRYKGSKPGKTRLESFDVNTAIEDIVKGRPLRKKGAAPPEQKEDGGEARFRILPLRTTLSIVIKICEAVQFAHSRGVLHRDIKPANIMVRQGEDPVVMDFGLAKMALDEDLSVSMSMSGQILGTIEYMAPEQAESSHSVDERADVFSLGAVLYQMITGRRHFYSSSNVLADIARIKEHRPSSPRKVNRDIEPDLENIVLKALRPDPSERYRNVGELKEDLEHYRDGQMVLARAATLFEISRRLMRRHKAVFAVIFLSILMFLFGAVWFVYSLEMERRKAVDDKIAAEDAREEMRKARDDAVMEKIAADHAREVALNADNKLSSSLKTAEDRERRASLMEAELAKKEKELLGEKLRLASLQKEAEQAKKAAEEWRLEAEKLAAAAMLREKKGREGQAIMGMERYALSIARAQEKIEAKAVAEARQVLDGCDKALRNWEWGHLLARCGAGASSVLLSKQADARNAAAFSQDSGSIAFQDQQKVGILDIPSLAGGVPDIKDLKNPAQSPSTCLVFSADGGHLFIASADKSARIFETRTGRSLAKLQGLGEAVSGAAFSPDSETLATSSVDRVLRLWSAKSGDSMAAMRFSEWVKGMTFSADSSRLLVWAGKEAHLLDMSTNKIAGTMKGHELSINCGALSADGKLALTGGNDKRFVLWDLPACKELRSFNDNKAGISSVAFSPDHSRMLVMAMNGVLRLIDSSGGKELFRGACPPAGAPAAFSSDGLRLVATGESGDLLMVDASSGELLRTIRKKGAQVASVAFSPDQKRLLVAYADGRIHLLDTISGMEMLSLAADKRLDRAVFSPDGRGIYTLGTMAALFVAEAWQPEK